MPCLASPLLRVLASRQSFSCFCFSNFTFNLKLYNIFTACQQQEHVVLTQLRFFINIHHKSKILILKSNQAFKYSPNSLTNDSNFQNGFMSWNSFAYSGKGASATQLMDSTSAFFKDDTVPVLLHEDAEQRRATRWIMMRKRGELSYKERLSALNLLPLTYDREIKDLVFLYKALFGYVNVDVSNFVSFVCHGRTRLSNSSKYILQSQICRTNTFQSL